MKISARELKNLGIAGLLHDIGKCKIALDIINKPGPLDDLECEEIKKHPLYGYKIVKESQLAAPGVERAVLQHHEHQDGSGYPLKMKGKAIHTYSNIVAVADVFDALTSDRVYRSRMPLLHAIDLILKKTFGHLDPLISRSLSQYVLNISPGERVLLNSGERATVIKINENNPTRPLVKMGEAFIDLENERHIYIEDMLD